MQCYVTCPKLSVTDIDWNMHDLWESRNLNLRQQASKMEFINKFY